MVLLAVTAMAAVTLGCDVIFLLILTWCHFRGALRAPMACLLFFSIADIVRLVPLIVGEDVSSQAVGIVTNGSTATTGDLNDEHCTVIALFMWYGIWSSVLWMMAYTHALRVHFGHASERRYLWGLTQFRVYHLLCWFGPVVALVPPLALHLFGTREHIDLCTFKNQHIGTVYASVTFVAFVYNLVCLWQVHRFLQREANGASLFLDAAAVQRLRSATRVWPTFLLYSMAFFISQVPFCVVAATHVTASIPALDVLCQMLYWAHGLLNIMVYGGTVFYRSAVHIGSRWLHRPTDQQNVPEDQEEPSIWPSYRTGAERSGSVLSSCSFPSSCSAKEDVGGGVVAWRISLWAGQLKTRLRVAPMHPSHSQRSALPQIVEVDQASSIRQEETALATTHTTSVALGHPPPAGDGAGCSSCSLIRHDRQLNNGGPGENI